MLNQKANEVFNAHGFNDFRFIVGFDGKGNTELIRSEVFTRPIFKNSTFGKGWSFCVADNIGDGESFWG